MIKLLWALVISVEFNNDFLDSNSRVNSTTEPPNSFDDFHLGVTSLHPKIARRPTQTFNRGNMRRKSYA